jgi:putative membrane protein
MLVVAVALPHLYFLCLEMFLWTKPAGLKIFRNTPERAEIMKALAANQGLYNGFLAAGLFWALIQPSRIFEFEIKMFFLGCVVVAALFGAATVSRRILFVQGLPALVALVITVGFDNPYFQMTVCCGKPQTAQSLMNQVQ